MERLFKAKKKTSGEWVEGYLAKAKWYLDEKEMFVILPTDLCIYPHCEFSEWIEIDKTTICQYTGLIDKNSNKIWENDIVSFSHSRLRKLLSVDAFGFPNFEMAEYKRNYAIEFVNTYCTYGLRFRNKSIHFPCKLSTLRMHDVEVIGNIFDNPELLQEDKR